MFRLENKTNKDNINKDNTNKIFITVAGNVGAGKSTLTKLVGEKLGIMTHFEKVEGNPYLEDFYINQEAYGFHLQLYFLAQRFKQQVEIENNQSSNIQDRSIYEDVEIFAKNLFDNNKLSSRDFLTYKELFEDMVPYLNKPDLMIFLDGSIETILHRINNRGREVEKEVNIEYWENLHKRYKSWIQEYNYSPVLHVNIDEFDLINNPEHLDLLCDEIEKALK